jgi:transposase
MFVVHARFEPCGLVVRVRPTWRKPRCGQCSELAPHYDRRTPRRWRHLGLGTTVIWLEYAPRRVRCEPCGVRTESVPWAPSGSAFTHAFEELVAYLARATDRTAASRLAGVAWVTVGSIVARVVARKSDESPLDGVRRIAIDEFSYRKRHRYVTVVVDHDERRVIWAAEGRSAETLGRFFDELGPERCAQLELATIDMSGAYIKALTERVPHVKIVYDRFHVERLAHDAVDEVRREEQQAVRGKPEAKRLKGMRFSLLRGERNLTDVDIDRLNLLQRDNRRLYRAYLLKEALAAAMALRDPAGAELAIKGWIAWAVRSQLKPFVRVARTIRKHLGGVLAYARHRATNGIVEGFDNRLRTIARRPYGFHGSGPLIAMLFLCCGGIQLNPPLPRGSTFV